MELWCKIIEDGTKYTILPYQPTVQGLSSQTPLTRRKFELKCIGNCVQYCWKDSIHCRVSGNTEHSRIRRGDGRG